MLVVGTARASQLVISRVDQITPAHAEACDTLLCGSLRELHREVYEVIVGPPG